MQLSAVKKENSPGLLVVFLGWACTPQVIEHLSPQGWDVVCVYDYRLINSSPARDELSSSLSTLCRSYREIVIAAWSFGVLAAEYLTGGLKYDRAIAFNGTPHPVHEQYGIQPRRFSITLRGLHTGGMEPFLKKTYGGWYAPGKIETRPTGENITELEQLGTLAAKHREPSIKWDRAVIGSDDVIFPPQNMVAFWGVSAQVLTLPHYPFADPSVLYDELRER